MSKLPIADVPALAGLEALAARCKAGDPEALQEYQDTVQTLLDQCNGLTPEESDEKYRLWGRLVDLNREILEAADRRRRLFGHERARVFILGDRLAIVHPRELPRGIGC